MVSKSNHSHSFSKPMWFLSSSAKLKPKRVEGEESIWTIPAKGY